MTMQPGAGVPYLPHDHLIRPFTAARKKGRANPAGALCRFRSRPDDRSPLRLRHSRHALQFSSAADLDPGRPASLDRRRVRRDATHAPARNSVEARRAATAADSPKERTCDNRRGRMMTIAATATPVSQNGCDAARRATRTAASTARSEWATPSELIASSCRCRSQRASSMTRFVASSCLRLMARSVCRAAAGHGRARRGLPTITATGGAFARRRQSTTRQRA
jgi:hypothetical protein